MVTTLNLGALGLNWLGVYNGAATYKKNDLVRYDVSSYIYINAVASSGNLPTDGAYWNLVAQGSAGGAVSSVFGRSGDVLSVAGDYNFDDIAGVSQDVLIGRLTAGTGVQEALTAAQVRTLLGIEAAATADQTGAEIKSLYEAEADTNSYDDASSTKLSGIEAAATADQTDAEIETAYSNRVSQVNSSEITAGTETSVRRFSPADVKSIVAVHGGSGGGGVSTNLLDLSLRVADLEGDALGIIDGIADPFHDETDVDTGSSTNQNWVLLNQLYSVLLNVGTNILPQMTGSTTGGVTVTANAQQSGSEAYKAFDNNTGTQWSAGQLGEGELLIDFGSVIDVAGYTMASSLDSVASDSVASFNLQKSDDGINFTTIDTQAGLSWTLSEIKNFNLPSTHSARYFRFANMIPTGGVGGGWNKSSEIQLLSPGSVNDMALQSSAFTADATPTTARLLFHINPIDSITINTDVIASVSRDGGVTWSVATLVERMTYSDGTLLYEDSNVDLSGQPAGTAMKWKLETANGKNINVSGVVLQWS